MTGKGILVSIIIFSITFFLLGHTLGQMRASKIFDASVQKIEAIDRECEDKDDE